MEFFKTAIKIPQERALTFSGGTLAPVKTATPARGCSNDIAVQ